MRTGCGIHVCTGTLLADAPAAWPKARAQTWHVTSRLASAGSRRPVHTATSEHWTLHLAAIVPSLVLQLIHQLLVQPFALLHLLEASKLQHQSRRTRKFGRKRHIFHQRRGMHTTCLSRCIRARLFLEALMQQLEAPICVCCALVGAAAYLPRSCSRVPLC